MAQGDAMEKLRSGEIDATICSCPTPVPAFANVKGDAGFRFVSVPFEKPIQASYLPATIRGEEYPSLMQKEEVVDTIAAITILISFNWPRDSIRYKRTAKFVDAFFSKFNEFHKPPRHPLWKTTNLAATIPGWTRFPAAEEWLANWRSGQAKGQEEAFRRFMSERTPIRSSEQTEQLFREFLIWSNKQK